MVRKLRRSRRSFLKGIGAVSAAGLAFPHKTVWFSMPSFAKASTNPSATNLFSGNRSVVKRYSAIFFAVLGPIAAIHGFPKLRASL